jgi:hypothetical protein
VIRAAHPTAIIGTKFAAWQGRGDGDVLTSLDLHDVMALVDGRPELAEELAEADLRLKSFIVSELGAVRDERFFGYLLQSATSGYGPVAEDRVELLRERIDVLIHTCGE